MEKVIVESESTIAAHIAKISAATVAISSQGGTIARIQMVSL